MRTNSKSLKKAAGTLVLTVSVVSAVFGLTACGSHGGGLRGGGGGFRGGGGNTAYSAPLHAGHIVK